MTIISSDSEEQANFSALILNAIRIAVLRCRLDENELHSIGIALRGGMISPDGAIEWLSDIGLCDQVIGQIADSTNAPDMSSVDGAAA